MADKPFNFFDYVIDEGEDGTLEKILSVLDSHEIVTKGGQGSGNFGHSGRQGEVGGSGSEESKPDISNDSVETPIPTEMQTLHGIKQKLNEGTWVIVSGEKAGLRDTENKSRSVGMKRVLENYSTEIVGQEGKWGGSTEHSYVARIDEKKIPELENLFLGNKEFDQQAYILIQNGKTELRYQNGTKQVGTVDSIQEAKGADDNYSKIGELKYRMNFE